MYDKQELVREASVALASLDQQYQSQLEAATQLHHQETAQLQATISALQKVRLGRRRKGGGVGDIFSFSCSSFECFGKYCN